MNKKECIVCQRIAPSIVFATGHKILDGKASKEKIHEICVEAIECINYADKKNRIFFCGLSSGTLLGGLFYLLIFKNNMRITQNEIAAALGKKHYSGGYNIAFIAAGYKRWYINFPELFESIKDWVRWKTQNFDWLPWYTKGFS